MFSYYRLSWFYISNYILIKLTLVNSGYHYMNIFYYIRKKNYCNWFHYNNHSYQTQSGLIGQPGIHVIQQNSVETLFLLYFFSSQRPLFFHIFRWLLTHFNVHYINIKKTFYFFNMKFKMFYYIYSIFIRKKLCFFLCGIFFLFKYFNLK